jgi:hypothetical protein
MGGCWNSTRWAAMSAMATTPIKGFRQGFPLKPLSGLADYGGNRFQKDQRQSGEIQLGKGAPKTESLRQIIV